VRPARTPIGLHLSQTARVVSRAFDDALAQAGGSLPAWLVLLNLKARPRASQRQLAEAIGVREATLTHHLNAMDAQGLLTRRRDPANRRVHQVELTDAGEAAFLRLRDAAASFDRKLRNDFTDADLDSLGTLLDRLARNVSASQDGPPWAGLAETTAPARAARAPVSDSRTVSRTPSDSKGVIP
jgi:MarR family transcriptional regulator, transcriptional regulator for hemolysin